jgi:hypothetical protein
MVLSIEPEIGRQTQMIDFDSLMAFFHNASWLAFTIIDEIKGMLGKITIAARFNEGKQSSGSSTGRV